MGESVVRKALGWRGGNPGACKGGRHRPSRSYGFVGEGEEWAAVEVPGGLALVVVSCARCGAVPVPDAAEGSMAACYRCGKPGHVEVGGEFACAKHFLQAQGGSYRVGDEVKPLV